MTSELDVWLFSDRIGTLSLDRGALGFSYSNSWLQRTDSVALSISLAPAEPTVYRSAGAPVLLWFIAGMADAPAIVKAVANINSKRFCATGIYWWRVCRGYHVVGVR